MVLCSPIPDVVIPDVTFSEFVLQHLLAYGDNIALIEADENGRTTTCRQLYDSVILCAAALNKLGVKEGEVVAVSLVNRREFAVIVLATAACGGVLTTCNPNYTEDEIAKQFGHSRPKILFVESINYQKNIAVSKRVDSIKNIFTVQSTQGSTSFQELVSKADKADFPFDRRPEKRETPFYLPYSSGTTGLPKRVMLSQRNMVSIVLLASVMIRLSSKDTYYLVQPVFHMFGTMMTFCSIVQGAKLVLQRRFTVKRFLESVQQYKITTLEAVPPVVLEVNNSSFLSSYDTSSLSRITCGGAPLPEVAGQEFKKRLAVDFYQNWGLTEALPLTATIDRLTSIKSVGQVAVNTKLKIIDTETGLELEANQKGEICTKGPQVTIGYYKNPQATSTAIDVDGWFHTGDVGYFDEHGHIYIVDRLKELIKVKGFQVAPAELEEILLTHPAVADAAVIGVPHLKSGEVPKAFIVTKDRSLTESGVHKYLHGKVSSYKYLDGGIVFCDVIPKSASGKILRRKLREREAKSRL